MQHLIPRIPIIPIPPEYRRLAFSAAGLTVSSIRLSTVCIYVGYRSTYTNFREILVIVSIWTTENVRHERTVGAYVIMVTWWLVVSVVISLLVVITGLVGVYGLILVHKALTLLLATYILYVDKVLTILKTILVVVRVIYEVIPILVLTFLDEGANLTLVYGDWLVEYLFGIDAVDICYEILLSFWRFYYTVEVRTLKLIKWLKIVFVFFKEVFLLFKELCLGCSEIIYLYIAQQLRFCWRGIWSSE
jgi:hypothetical protein